MVVNYLILCHYSKKEINISCSEKLITMKANPTNHYGFLKKNNTNNFSSSSQETVKVN